MQFAANQTKHRMRILDIGVPGLCVLQIVCADFSSKINCSNLCWKW